MYMFLIYSIIWEFCAVIHLRVTLAVYRPLINMWDIFVFCVCECDAFILVLFSLLFKYLNFCFHYMGCICFVKGPTLTTAWTCLVIQSCPILCDPMDSSVHGTSQARMLEWVAISYSRGSSWPRDWTHVSRGSCTGRRILYHWATWEAKTKSCCAGLSHSVMPDSLWPHRL